MSLLLILSFALGICIGSFLNALVYRLAHEEKGIVNGRSFCPKCKHTLSVRDLIPLFSYLFLRGSCRYCKHPISVQYPVVEAITGISFVAIATMYLQDPVQMVFYWIVAAGLITISTFDIIYQLIPYKISWFLIILSLLYLLFLGDGIFFHIIGAVVLGGFLYGISKIKIRGQQAGGEGDAELGVIMGLILGLSVGTLSLFISYILGAVVSIILLSMKNARMNTQIPFGPFLSLGIILGILFGNDIIELYLSLIGWK